MIVMDTLLQYHTVNGNYFARVYSITTVVRCTRYRRFDISEPWILTSSVLFVWKIILKHTLLMSLQQNRLWIRKRSNEMIYTVRQYSDLHGLAVLTAVICC